MAATALLGTAAGASGPTAGSGGGTAPWGIKGSPGPFPGAGASIGQWQSWAAAQTRAAETTTWASEVASTGGQLVSVTYIPVTDAPGIPAGVVTTAVSLVVSRYNSATSTAGPAASLTASAGVGTAGATASAGLTVNPLASGGSCNGITSGVACISYYTTSGGMDIEASYQYGSLGSVTGHVELSVNGCPGSAVANGYNRTLTNGQAQVVIYGPVYYTAEWASSFWRNNGGGNYTYFGSACNYF